MKVVVSHSGDYLKGDRRYRAIPTGPHETPISVRAEMLEKGYEFSPLSVLDLAKARKLTEFALRRWTEEVAGIEIAGVQFASDEKTRAVFADFHVRVNMDPTYSVKNYKLPDGQFIELTPSMILAIDKALHDHVQAGFDKEEALSKQIIGCLTANEVGAIKWSETDPDPQGPPQPKSSPSGVAATSGDADPQK